MLYMANWKWGEFQDIAPYLMLSEEELRERFHVTGGIFGDLDPTIELDIHIKGIQHSFKKATFSHILELMAKSPLGKWVK